MPEPRSVAGLPFQPHGVQCPRLETALEVGPGQAMAPAVPVGSQLLSQHGLPQFPLDNGKATPGLAAARAWRQWQEGPFQSSWEQPECSGGSVLGAAGGLAWRCGLAPEPAGWLPLNPRPCCLQVGSTGARGACWPVCPARGCTHKGRVHGRYGGPPSQSGQGPSASAMLGRPGELSTAHSQPFVSMETPSSWHICLPGLLWEAGVPVAKPLHLKFAENSAPSMACSGCWDLEREVAQWSWGSATGVGVRGWQTRHAQVLEPSARQSPPAAAHGLGTDHLAGSPQEARPVSDSSELPVGTLLLSPAAVGLSLHCPAST